MHVGEPLSNGSDREGKREKGEEGTQDLKNHKWHAAQHRHRPGITQHKRPGVRTRVAAVPYSLVSLASMTCLAEKKDHRRDLMMHFRVAL